MTFFKKLNLDWSAEPNAPSPQTTIWDRDIILSFYLNAFIYPPFKEGDIGQVRFQNYGRYGFSAVNDEGWYSGQCRFSKIAPAWGEFYEISGELLLDQFPGEWKEAEFKDPDQKHFLFYFRDETFECEAVAWSFSVLKVIS